MIDVPALIAERRQEFGRDFVSGRTRPEAEARALLDASAGSMTREQAMRLGELLNEHTKGGVVRHDRFSPAFVGASLQRVIEDLATFNERVRRLWRGDDEAALDALDETLRNRALFPGAGSSFPSVLLYLRDPNRYAVWIAATINGLSKVTGESSATKSGGRRAYLQFCDQVRRFREQYGVAPQETDAILSEASRRIDDVPTQVPSGAPSIEALAEACSLPVELVEEWAGLLLGPKRQAIFYGPVVIRGLILKLRCLCWS